MATRKRLLTLGAVAVFGIALSAPAMGALSPQSSKPAGIANVPTEVAPQAVYDQPVVVTHDPADVIQHPAGHYDDPATHDVPDMTGTSTVHHAGNGDCPEVVGHESEHSEPADHAGTGEHMGGGEHDG